jgi:hypothetical protein
MYTSQPCSHTQETVLSAYIAPCICISVTQFYVHTFSKRKDTFSFIPSKRNKIFSIIRMWGEASTVCLLQHYSALCEVVRPCKIQSTPLICGRFYDSVSNSELVATNFNCWIWKWLKRNCPWTNPSNIPIFAWRNCIKPQNTILAMIWPRFEPGISQIYASTITATPVLQQ